MVTHSQTIEAQYFLLYFTIQTGLMLLDQLGGEGSIPVAGGG